MTVYRDTGIREIVTCYHCGNDCDDRPVISDDRFFCCDGCLLVYDILKENNLCSYYNYNDAPGTRRKKNSYHGQFGYLDDKEIQRKLIQFTDGKITSVSFYIPQIHCSSCIWLLENLNRINPGVIKSIVNFTRKEAAVTFQEEKITLRQLVEMLSAIGYEPAISLDDAGEKKAKCDQRTVAYKIGIAGFCFGNIMLFSFPEYFSAGVYHEEGFKGVFSYLNFALSLPVFFYCSSQFFTSALHSLKQKFMNIDVPIALGILVMFLRSSYEILSATGAGYMDTLSGLVFFMLVGRAFQNKTYETISFERDYKSFFPVSVMVEREGIETSIPVSGLRLADRIIIRNEELIPADSVLLQGEANIDYSFVTGESLPVKVNEGETVYAGGKQTGTAIHLQVVKNVSQSYLTRLWNNNLYDDTREESGFQQTVNRISHYFTLALLLVALVAFCGWALTGDPARGLNAFTAVLIIACPCALAISSPFTLGNIVRFFGRKKFYLKNHTVIEKLARVNTVVFDKTGTLTRTSSSKIEFHGEALSADENRMVKSLLRHSSHPLSRLLDEHLDGTGHVSVTEFREIPGKGIRGKVYDIPVLLGSAGFCDVTGGDKNGQTRIHVKINSILRGYFSVSNEYRQGAGALVQRLKKYGYRLAVLSGDHEGERENLEEIFGKETPIRFNQSPADKLNFIRCLQRENRNVLMIGDGLNDAGALKQSEVGISVSDNINNFSPACDGILSASSLNSLSGILKVSKASRRIILASFVIAAGYNLVGLSFAVGGRLSPVIAAILMPLSTVTIIVFTTAVSNWYAKNKL
jgi:Cu+-exporting ATPase